MKRPLILIANAITWWRNSVKRLLETEFDVVGTETNGRALVRAASEKDA